MKKPRHFATLAAVLLCVAAGFARGQSEGQTLRPVTRAELVGYWTELFFPAAVSSKFKLRPTVQYQCQFLRFRNDGRIDKVSLSGMRECPNDPGYLRKTLDAVPQAGDAAAHFEHRDHPNGSSLLVTRGADQPDGHATWLLVAASGERSWNGVEIRSGDLLMFLFLDGQDNPLEPVSYLRWLRPIPQPAR